MFLRVEMLETDGSVGSVSVRGAVLKVQVRKTGRKFLKPA